MKGISAGLALVAVIVLAACGSTKTTAAATSAPATIAPSATLPASSSTETTASPGTSSSGQPGAVSVAPGWPAMAASDFVAAIDNPWFPLKAGTSWVSRGVKDGKPTVDHYVVTGQTKQIEGVPCNVIRDTLTSNGKVVEATWDWYAQDKQGNVWYFGEDTKEYNAGGKVTSTAGTWEAGVKGAMAGIYIPAHPRIGAGGYQEFYAGQALDKFVVISLSASVRVPYGSFTGALETQETTALEPNVVDHKYYVKGLGQVGEVSVKGPKETALLVSRTTK
jgi:hypothetical protein